MLLIAIIIMDLLAGVEFDLFVTSFPELQSHFQLSPFWVEALLSTNFIGYCTSLFFVGGLADRYGRKPILLLGLATFILGSSLCLLTASYPALLFGRFLQGVGIASPAILSFLIIADSFPLKKQQFYLAMLNGIMNSSVAIAPVIGSYITLYFHWQGNFTALFLLGVVSLIMTALFVPSQLPPGHKEPFSLRGYIPILQAKPLMLLIMSLVVMFVPYWIFVGISPILYMEHLGVSLAHFGYYQGALALAFALGSVLYGLIINRYDQKKMLILSCGIFAISLLAIACVAFVDSKNPLIITCSLLLFVIGQIIPSTILYPVILNVMPQAKGQITALIQGGRLILSSLGLQLAALCYVGSFQNIGIIIALFILLTTISQYFVIKSESISLAPCNKTLC